MVVEQRLKQRPKPKLPLTFLLVSWRSPQDARVIRRRLLRTKLRKVPYVLIVFDAKI